MPKRGRKGSKMNKNNGSESDKNQSDSVKVKVNFFKISFKISDDFYR